MHFEPSEFADVFSVFNSGKFLGAIKISKEGKLNFSPYGRWYRGNTIFAEFHRYLARQIVLHNRRSIG